MKEKLTRNRYYELKHFCLQYREYMKLREQSLDEPDKVVKFNDRITLIEETVKKADENIADQLLLAVTKGCPYEYLKTYKNLNVTEEEFKDSYRRFFSLLDEQVS